MINKKRWLIMSAVVFISWGLNSTMISGAECMKKRVLDLEDGCEPRGSGKNAYCIQKWTRSHESCKQDKDKQDFCTYSVLSEKKCNFSMPVNGICEVIDTTHVGTCWVAAAPTPTPTPPADGGESGGGSGGGDGPGINQLDTGTLGNTVIVTFPDSGEPRVYFFGLDVQKISLKLVYGGNTKSVNSIADGDYVDLGMTVASGSSVLVKTYDQPGYGLAAYGWKEPENNNKCMQKDISGLIMQAEFYGKPLVATQCWADGDSASEDFDYDDWVLIFSYKTDTSPSPSPPPPPVPPSSSEPSVPPEADQASFVIHKFLDANRNGVRETGEGPTNREWKFDYQINNGEKQEYVIEPGSEKGEIILAAKGAKIKLSELGQEGWLNTTGAELTKALSEAKLYTFYFGNWPVNGAAGAPAGGFPPSQPETGTQTWLTLSLALSIILMTIIKVRLKV